MGCQFEFIASHEKEQFAFDMIQIGIDETRRIENLLSEFNRESTTSFLNSNPKQYISVSTEFFELVKRCINISELTQGSFDITVTALKKLYSFKNQSIRKFPSNKTLRNVIDNIGYKNIFLRNDQKIKLNNNIAKISFSGIGKGYAADCVKRLWLKEGLKSGVINASGDLTVIGCKPDGSKWKIGVPDPQRTKNMLFYVPIENQSVATSGNYEQFFIKDGIKYSHNLDPKTGMPLTGISSVTLISPSAELSDAIATAVYVMGIEAGIYLVDQLPNTYCIIVDSSGQLFKSKSIDISEVLN